MHGFLLYLIRNCVCRVQNDNTTVVKRKPEKKTAKVASITVMIYFHIILHPSIHIMIFITFITLIIILSWVYNEPIQRHAPSWLVSSIGKSAEPVSQRSRVQIPYKPEFFSGFLFATAKVAFYNCDDLLSYNSSPRSSHIWFSYVHNLIIILLQFLRS